MNFNTLYNSVENDYGILVNMYLLKVNNRNTRKRCKICSKLTTKTPEKRHRHTFTYFALFASVFIGYVKQVNVC